MQKRFGESPFVSWHVSCARSVFTFNSSPFLVISVQRWFPFRAGFGRRRSVTRCTKFNSEISRFARHIPGTRILSKIRLPSDEHRKHDYSVTSDGMVLGRKTTFLYRSTKREVCVGVCISADFHWLQGPKYTPVRGAVRRIWHPPQVEPFDLCVSELLDSVSWPDVDTEVSMDF